MHSCRQAQADAMCAPNVEEMKMNLSVYNRPYVCMYNKHNASMTVSGLAMHLEEYDHT